MIEAPRDHVLHRVEDLVPGSAKRLGRFLPGEPARPAGQKQRVGFGESTFAIGPGDLLDDDHLAAAAIDAPHGVKQKNQKSPESRSRFGGESAMPDQLSALYSEFLEGCYDCVD